MDPKTLSASISNLVNGKFQTIKQADWTPQVIKQAKGLSVFQTDLSPEGVAQQDAFFNDMVKHFEWPTECPITHQTLVKVSIIPNVDFDGKPITDERGAPTKKRVISCSAISRANSADVLRTLLAGA
jgi:hypothetical protein